MLRFNKKIRLYPLILLILFGCNSSNENAESVSAYAVNPNVPDYQTLIGNDFMLDAQHSYLGFKIRYFGYSPVRGRFNDFNGTMFYDENNEIPISASVFIDAASINTGNETRDEDLKEGSWFDVPNYPMASFQSKEIRVADDGGFRMVGLLTIKGISKEISLFFEKPTKISRDWASNRQIDFAGKAIINRQDFEVFGGDFWSKIMEDGLTQLSDEVEIELNLHCRKSDYKARYDSALATDVDKILLDHTKSYGIASTLQKIDSLNILEEISSGKLSTIGYTLQEWDMIDPAYQVFMKKIELFGPSAIVYNQLGINRVLAGDINEAKNLFNEALKLDSVNSRAIEYLRLMDNWSK